MAAGQLDLAVKLQNKLTSQAADVTWRQEDLHAVIRGYLGNSQFDAAIPLLRQHIDLFRAHRVGLQFLLIKLLLKTRRTLEAMRAIDTVDLSSLDAEQKKALAQLQSVANRQGGIGY